MFEDVPSGKLSVREVNKMANVWFLTGWDVALKIKAVSYTHLDVYKRQSVDNQADPAKVDLLYSNNAKAIAAGEAVDLAFKHKLSQRCV